MKRARYDSLKLDQSDLETNSRV